jgi:hypothetical protein
MGIHGRALGALRCAGDRGRFKRIASGALGVILAGNGLLVTELGVRARECNVNIWPVTKMPYFFSGKLWVLGGCSVTTTYRCES